MKPLFMSALSGLFLVAAPSLLAQDSSLPFKDNLEARLGPGWSWVRENPKGWRLTRDGLEIRVEPGNMWGGANNARNILKRAIPRPFDQPLDIQVTVENRPTEQYEQVDLVWYYDDSHQVKIGQELVDGQLMIVMGREEKDRTRTLAKIPIKAFKVDVRLVATPDQRITGYYRTPGMDSWKQAAACKLPVNGHPHITLQCYQGPAKTEHWAKLTGFILKRAD